MAGLKKLLILIIIGVIGFNIYRFFFTKKEFRYALTTSEITKGDIVATVTATGELNAISVVEVGTQVSGTVQEIYADFNPQVKAGELIALSFETISS